MSGPVPGGRSELLDPPRHLIDADAQLPIGVCAASYVFNEQLAIIRRLSRYYELPAHESQLRCHWMDLAESRQRKPLVFFFLRYRVAGNTGRESSSIQSSAYFVLDVNVARASAAASAWD